MEEAIKIRLKYGYLRREPRHLNYITAGEAVVYNEANGGVLMKMTKSKVFGESLLTEKISSNSLGDIRSGIRPL